MPKLYRGYICSRIENGRSVPQHIQQLVIRDYCQRNDLKFLLSATEYIMDGCSMMLDAITEDGIVLYSMFLLPRERTRRETIYRSGKDIHFAAENCCLSSMNTEDMEAAFTIVEYQQSDGFGLVIERLREEISRIK